MKKKIAVLLGGISSERNISIKSGKSILKSLLKSGLHAKAFDTLNFSLKKFESEKFNQAYIALHGKGGEDGSIQGVLEYLNIPYTGSRILSSSIAIDKFKTKLLWKSIKLPVIPDIYINRKKKSPKYSWEKKILKKLKPPVLIKPNSQGSSIGITLASNIQEISKSLHNAFKYDDNILIEKFIKGREYTVSILGKNILPSIYISTKHKFYDYKAKYQSSTTKYICPSGLTYKKEKELKKIIYLAWNVLGCTGSGRIDVILDEQDQFWLLEVNTIPGMTDRSLLPIAAKKYGISFDELVLSILNMSY